MYNCDLSDSTTTEFQKDMTVRAKSLEFLQEYNDNLTQDQRRLFASILLWITGFEIIDDQKRFITVEVKFYQEFHATGMDGLIIFKISKRKNTSICPEK